VKVNGPTRQKLQEIGAMIRAAREEAEISQATLAATIGMARENYLRIEKGRANVTVETLVRIAAGLDLTLSVALDAAYAPRPRRKR
jgi:transcriptional regulator with XRE-family HTH domain